MQEMLDIAGRMNTRYGVAMRREMFEGESYIALTVDQDAHRAVELHAEPRDGAYQVNARYYVIMTERKLVRETAVGEYADVQTALRKMVQAYRTMSDLLVGNAAISEEIRNPTPDPVTYFVCHGSGDSDHVTKIKVEPDQTTLVWFGLESDADMRVGVSLTHSEMTVGYWSQSGIWTEVFTKYNIDPAG